MGVVDLIALPADGSEVAFDGTAVPPGVHLRWSFRPDLGWPPGGFEVWRRFWSVDEFTRPSPESWRRIAVLDLPATGRVGILTVRRRIGSVSGSGVGAIQDDDYESLLSLVEQVRPGAAAWVAATRGSTLIRVPALDTLLLAAVDPYVARAIGLAYVDGSVPAGTPADYRVVGKWGTATAAWNRTDFTALTAVDLGGAPVRGQRCLWFSDRARAAVARDDRPDALELAGVGALGLRLWFASRAREVELDLESPTAAEAVTRWRLTGRSGGRTLTTAAGSPDRLTVTSTGAVLRILAPADRRLDEIEIVDTVGGFTTWRLTGIRHRGFTGPIRDQSSRVLQVSPISAAAEEHLAVRWPPPRVVTPRVARVEPTAVATDVGDDGRVRLDRSEIAAVMATPTPPPAGTPDLTRPARIHIGYSGGPSARSEVLTRSGVASERPLRMVGHWRLDGTTALRGPALVSHGNVAFVDARPTELGLVDLRRRTLALAGQGGVGMPGPGYLAAATALELDTDGGDLHVQVWVMPDRDPEQYPTLVGNNFRQSFWLGLNQQAGVYRPRLWLNGSLFEADGTIAVRRWSHVAFHYTGRRIDFYLDGKLDSYRTAALGPVRPNPVGRLSIGCDPTLSAPYAYPFCGFLTDLQIRRGVLAGFDATDLLAGWTFDGDLRERVTGGSSSAVGPVGFSHDHPTLPGRQCATFAGISYVTAMAPGPADPGRRLCVRLSVKPEPGQTDPVLVGTRHWSVALRGAGTGYLVEITVGGVTVSSALTLPAGAWSDLVAAVDGDRATLHVNGLPAGTGAVHFGRVPRDLAGLVRIAASPDEGHLTRGYRGRIADLEIGRVVPAPPRPVILADRSRETVDPFGVGDRPAPDEPPADLIVRDLAPGNYRVRAQGVDVFGRVGEWVNSSTVVVKGDIDPPTPGGARARFLPVLGQVVAATAPGEGSPAWSIGIGLTRPSTLDADLAARLLRHDAELATVTAAEPVVGGAAPVVGGAAPAEGGAAPAEGGAAPVGGATRLRVDRAADYEILTAELTAPATLEVTAVAATQARLRPAVGQRVTIAHDRWLRTEWTWTGTQRVLAPFVDRFELMERRRRPAGDGWLDWAVLGGPVGVPVARVDVVAVDEHAAALVPTAVSHAGWRSLRDRGVVSLPEPADPAVPAGDGRRPRARIWRVTLPVRDDLPPSPGRLPPADLDPQDFVPGALIAYNAAPPVRAWQLLPVLWHEWSPGTGWTVYLVENSKGRPAPDGPTPQLSQARYYPGPRYRLDAALATPVTFGLDPAGRPVGTVALEVMVVSVAATGERSFSASVSAGDPPPPRSGGAADVVAVDRRRPPRPPRPQVSIERADVNGRSRARIGWDAPDPVAGFQVYRATDQAVYLHDTQQRRLGTGWCAGLGPDDRMADDPDFTGWLAARWPDWVTGWRTRLFVPRPTDERDTTAAAAWAAASPVWREWAARFYPTLPVGALTAPTDPVDPGSLAGLAERAGNEEAFALVNSAPIAGGAHLDEVNGTVQNRYLYRLRAQSASLLRGTEWGPVSLPVAAPPTRPPRPPIVTGAVAGDRQARLRWRLDPDPRVSAYAVYRAPTAEELIDLRWRPADAVLPDPLLRVAGGVVALPADVPAGEVLAVYRADEPGPARYNLHRTDTEPPSRVVAGPAGTTIGPLRPVPDHTAAVVVLRDAAGTVHELGELGGGGEYVEEDLPPRVPVYYRMVTVDRDGLRSDGSPVSSARPYDGGPPPEPVWLAAAWEAGADGAETVVLRWQFPDAAGRTVRCQVQKRRADASRWLPASGWLTPDAGPTDAWTFRDPRVETGADYRYRLGVSAVSGQESHFEAPPLARTPGGGP